MAPFEKGRNSRSASSNKLEDVGAELLDLRADLGKRELSTEHKLSQQGGAHISQGRHSHAGWGAGATA